MESSKPYLNVLDIVNCATRAYEIEEGGVYMCPTKGGAYSHRQCLYFGLYREKVVDSIADIKAVIDVYTKDKSEILWINGDNSPLDCQKKAIDQALHFRSDRLPIRVFVLGERFSTNFKKDSPGGMFGSKTYLNVNKVGVSVSGARELATKLNNKLWSEFGL